MTELLRARRWLAQAQHRLHVCRSFCANTTWEESDVLAALSWLWDAQERAALESWDDDINGYIRLADGRVTVLRTRIPSIRKTQFEQRVLGH